MTTPTGSDQPVTPPATKKRHTKRWIILGVIGVVIIASLASHKKSPKTDTNAAPAAATPTTTSGGSGATTTSEGTTTAQTGGGGGSNKATSDYTPHVSAGGSVFVDTQTWRILSARTAKSLGDQYTKQTADGVYLLVHAEVTNGKSKSVTFTSDVAKLEVAGNEYSPDSNGGTALLMSGAKTFLLKDLGPHVTTSGWVAFDVPRSALGQKPELCFHELGFGSSKGCIAVRA